MDSASSPVFDLDRIVEVVRSNFVLEKADYEIFRNVCELSEPEICLGGYNTSWGDLNVEFNLLHSKDGGHRFCFYVLEGDEKSRYCDACFNRINNIQVDFNGEDEHFVSDYYPPEKWAEVFEQAGNLEALVYIFNIARMGL